MAIQRPLLLCSEDLQMQDIVFSLSTTQSGFVVLLLFAELDSTLLQCMSYCTLILAKKV